MITNALKKIVDGKNLSMNEMVEVMTEIMEGQIDPVLIASFLTALRIKGETIAEITGATKVMREKSEKIFTGSNRIVDTCGTGGDGANTFNISTLSAFVTAGAGVMVAKHGNKAVSSRSGSADVLSALGVNIQADKTVMKRCLDESGIAFLFAPNLHPSMKYAGPVRRKLEFRTIFNLVGPLTNPAGASGQVIGVYDSKWVVPFANVLADLDSKRVYVVHGQDGLDEITLTGTTKIAELKDGIVSEYTIEPEDFGFSRCIPEDLKGGTPEENAKVIRDVLAGDRGPARDIALLNAGAAISVGLEISFAEGIKAGIKSIDTGAAKNKLDELVRISSIN